MAKFYKIEAEDEFDAVFAPAETENEAFEVLKKAFGPMPKSLCKFTAIDEEDLPSDADIIFP